MNDNKISGIISIAQNIMLRMAVNTFLIFIVIFTTYAANNKALSTSIQYSKQGKLININGTKYQLTNTIIFQTNSYNSIKNEILDLGFQSKLYQSYFSNKESSYHVMKKIDINESELFLSIIKTFSIAGVNEKHGNSFYQCFCTVIDKKNKTIVLQDAGIIENVLLSSNSQYFAIICNELEKLSISDQMLCIFNIHGILIRSINIANKRFRINDNWHSVALLDNENTVNIINIINGNVISSKLLKGYKIPTYNWNTANQLVFSTIHPTTNISLQLTNNEIIRK